MKRTVFRVGQRVTIPEYSRNGNVLTINLKGGTVTATDWPFVVVDCDGEEVVKLRNDIRHA